MHRLSLEGYLKKLMTVVASPEGHWGPGVWSQGWQESELFTVYSFIWFNLFLTKHIYYEFKWIKRKLLKASAIYNYQWIICNSPHDCSQHTSASPWIRYEAERWDPNLGLLTPNLWLFTLHHCPVWLLQGLHPPTLNAPKAQPSEAQ